MSQKATILYIEDDEASRALVERVLKYAGYGVIIASRALEGIDLAKKHRPDLILTDINLPDLSGREITVRLRTDPYLASVPIVALTAQSHDFERDKTFVAGVNGYIVKPIDINNLTNKIEEYLAGKKDEVDPDTIQPAQQAYNEELVERLEANVRELEQSYRDLRRMDRIKDDFIQLTAHEIRTPLTTVYGYSRLVQTSAPIQQMMAQNMEVYACITGLVESIERLHLVIDEIITIARIASGRVDLKLTVTNMGQMIQSVIEEYDPVVKQRGIKLNYDLATWPERFYGDKSLLELAFSNILGNAIKYTPDDGDIYLKIETVEEKRIRISVQDTGIGIDPSDQEQIFDRFYTAGDTQLHSTSKTAFRGGGLGLGLAICRGIVEAHGGKIWVESECCDEEKMPGATFFIELPIQTTQPGQPSTTVL